MQKNFPILIEDSDSEIHEVAPLGSVPKKAKSTSITIISQHMIPRANIHETDITLNGLKRKRGRPKKSIAQSQSAFMQKKIYDTKEKRVAMKRKLESKMLKRQQKYLQPKPIKKQKQVPRNQISEKILKKQQNDEKVEKTKKEEKIESVKKEQIPEKIDKIDKIDKILKVEKRQSVSKVQKTPRKKYMKKKRFPANFIIPPSKANCLQTTNQLLLGVSNTIAKAKQYMAMLTNRPKKMADINIPKIPTMNEFLLYCDLKRKHSNKITRKQIMDDFNLSQGEQYDKEWKTIDDITNLFNLRGYQKQIDTQEILIAELNQNWRIFADDDQLLNGNVRDFQASIENLVQFLGTGSMKVKLFNKLTGLRRKKQIEKQKEEHKQQSIQMKLESQHIQFIEGFSSLCELQPQEEIKYISKDVKDSAYYKQEIKEISSPYVQIQGSFDNRGNSYHFPDNIFRSSVDDNEESKQA